MVQSRAPLYPLQDGQLLCPQVGGVEHEAEATTFQ